LTFEKRIPPDFFTLKRGCHQISHFMIFLSPKKSNVSESK